MIVPSRRWYIIAAMAALLAPLSLVWPPATSVLVVFDVCWVLAFLVDASRAVRVDLAAFPVTREAPAAFSVGRTLPVVLVWRNPLSRTVTLRVREVPPALLESLSPADRELRLQPGTVLREVTDYLPVRRGKTTSGRLSLRLLGPLGLAWWQGHRDMPWAITVYPGLRSAALKALPAQVQRRREAGFRNIRRIGEGRVFESLREWVPGQETRSIDWKATARRGKLMARHYEDERRQQVMIVLDAGRLLTAEIDGRARLESAIDAALELAHSAVEHDDDVGLLVFADEILRFVPPARGRRSLRLVLDALASVEGRLVEPDYPAAFAYLAARNRKRALTVLFTDVIDRTASEAFVAQAGTLRPRHLPLAVTLRDPSLERVAARRPTTAAEAYERAAAEELLDAREGALADLRQRGVLVLDVLPDGAARAVVEQYDRLKRRAVI
ncbi:MAG TPA: DUF58 domain-containing protein [Gemmatimonadales bacterium]|jgi:uncharacterized protein (DUF58 family)|nr:DUF58 domain-containing protein [Gemmatimonadales bacterium]